jgi:hypothetical protein
VVKEVRGGEGGEDEDSEGRVGGEVMVMMPMGGAALSAPLDHVRPVCDVCDAAIRRLSTAQDRNGRRSVEETR